ncbi:MAG TPA: hypothetical protein EYH38_09890 [Leucothrix sp.]|nr:hypothetical protein [Leucothrix sp.]
MTIPFKTRLVANCFLTRCTYQTNVVGVLGANSIKGWLLSSKGSKTVNRVGGSVFVLFGFGLATSQR